MGEENGKLEYIILRLKIISHQGLFILLSFKAHGGVSFEVAA
jgi:hypothetical protein